MDPSGPVPDLARLPLLHGVEPYVLEPLAALLTPVEAPPGAVLMRQGEAATSFLVLTSGSVQVERRDDRGVASVAILTSQTMLGELALLRRSSRTASVTARSKVRALRGDERAFDLLLAVPDVRSRLTLMARRRTAALVRPVEIVLHDGTRLELRPVLPGDKQRVPHYATALSPETMYRRFLGSVKLTASVISYLTEVDYLDHFVWVAVTPNAGTGVAVARLVRVADAPDTAEVAFTVADDYQGRGLGSVLFGALAVAAAEVGVDRFLAEVLATNLPMRRLLDRAALPTDMSAGASWNPEGFGVVSTTIDVPPPHLFLPDDTVVAGLRDAVRAVMHVAG